MTKRKVRSADTFVKHTRALLENPRWHCLSINARRFIDFLELEHLRHGGRENGILIATHRQLVAYGISARLVAKTISEAENAGFVECTRPGSKGIPARFRLSYVDNITAIVLPENVTTLRPRRKAADRP